MTVHKGRFSAAFDSDFVVFLIGMRFNKPWKVWRWLPVARAMPAMLNVLAKHPELGCLGSHQWIGRTTILVQYWRSFEHLERFARADDLPHLEAWRRFNRAVSSSGDVGVWHETYQVQAGAFEAVYANMPVFGLAAATAHVPVAAIGHSSAARLKLTHVSPPPVEPYERRGSEITRPRSADAAGLVAERVDVKTAPAPGEPQRPDG